MELSSQEKSSVWWKGTLKSALKGLAIGLAAGAATALLLGGVGLAYAPLAAVFQGFVTMSGAFSLVPLAVFSGISGMLGGLLTGGASAVNAYHQQKHNQWQQAQDDKINELGTREQELEQVVAQSSSRSTQAILSKGQRPVHSFAEAEAARTNAPTTPTIQ